MSWERFWWLIWDFYQLRLYWDSFSKVLASLFVPWSETQRKSLDISVHTHVITTSFCQWQVMNLKKTKYLYGLTLVNLDDVEVKTVDSLPRWQKYWFKSKVVSYIHQNLEKKGGKLQSVMRVVKRNDFNSFISILSDYISKIKLC